MKRILLIVILILSITVQAYGNVSDWAESEINQALNIGFVPEELQSNFSDDITRAEFAKLAVSYLAFLYNTDADGMIKIYCDTHSVSPSENAFADCDSSDVLYAYTMNIVKGKGGGIFDPNGPITREEAAVMLMRTFFVYGGGLKHGRRITEFESYSDYGDISGWAIEDTAYAWEMGIMNGVSETKFSPKTHYTREQAAVTFLRLYNVWVHP